MNISLILAISTNGTIGKDNALPWHLPADLKRFKKLTTGHAIVMGRKTFESIGKPLPKRHNIVVTSQPQKLDRPQLSCVPSLRSALELAVESGEREEVFIIGGARLFGEALPLANRLYLTRVEATITGDVRFELPALEDQWRLIARESRPVDAKHDYSLTFETYERGSHRN